MYKSVVRCHYGIKFARQNVFAIDFAGAAAAAAHKRLSQRCYYFW